MLKEHTVRKCIDHNHPQQTLFQGRVLLGLVLPWIFQSQLMIVLSFYNCREKYAPATKTYLVITSRLSLYLMIAREKFNSLEQSTSSLTNTETIL